MDDLKLLNIVDDVDKLHRVGKIKQRNGKKMKDIIVKLKSHTLRYLVYNERKKAKNIRIAPNLTKWRGKQLYNAVLSTEDAMKVNFVYVDAHGDLKIRLNDHHNGRYVFPFNT